SLSLLLARNGYIVALAKHPGNSLGDNEQADSEQIFRDRPRQLIALLDALLGDASLGPTIAAEPVTAIGHSLGGYTVLSVAGGQPWSRARQPIAVAHDSRIGALVLMAPACGPFLAPRSLAALSAPI